MVISNVEIKMTRAVHTHSPGHHLITSWGQDEIFLAKERCHIIHYNWCLMQTLYSLRPSRCGLLVMMHHHPVILQPSFLFTYCPFLYLLPVSVPPLCITFIYHILALFSPSLLENCICIWA